MSKSMKQAIVDHVATALEEHDSAVVVAPGKMTVFETEALRNTLRAEGVQFIHLRNKLARVAFAKSGFDGLETILQGSTGMAFGGEGALAISKILVKEAKEIGNLEILGGFIDGEVIDAEGVTALSKMPGRKELQAMILQGMFGPVSDFSKSMDDLLTEVHGLIEALETKGGAEA